MSVMDEDIQLKINLPLVALNYSLKYSKISEKLNVHFLYDLPTPYLDILPRKKEL